MNAHSFFSIGKNHVVCEDYALSGTSCELAYAIVCDGCSASPDVDVGARIVAQSAKKNILSNITNNKGLDPIKFGNIIIQESSRIWDVLPYLDSQALDVTLLVAWIENNILTARLYGDGVLIHKSGNDVYAVNISLTSGAPDYLSYDLNSSRMLSYEHINNNMKNIETYELIGGNGSLITVSGEPLIPVTLTRPTKPGDIIAVISDGINSFRKSDNTKIGWIDLIEEFVGFKSTEGEFVQRRMTTFNRKNLKEGTVHYDDISISAIVV